MLLYFIDFNYKINYVGCEGWIDYYKCEFLWEIFLFEGVIKMYLLVIYGVENGLIDFILMINKL